MPLFVTASWRPYVAEPGSGRPVEHGIAIIPVRRGDLGLAPAGETAPRHGQRGGAEFHFAGTAEAVDRRAPRPQTAACFAPIVQANSGVSPGRHIATALVAGFKRVA